MNKYRVTFKARKIGAIGKIYNNSLTVEADNEEQAKLKLYDRFEHISQIKIKAIK